MFSKLFSWDDFDSDNGFLLFIGCTLKQQIGEFMPGSKISCITIDLSNAVMSFEMPNIDSEELEVVARHEISVSVGDSRWKKPSKILEEVGEDK